MPPAWRAALVSAALLCAAARAGAVDAGGAAITLPGCYSPSAAAADYFPDKLQFAADTTVNVAQYFSVEYAGFYKYVRDLRGPELKTYVLYQCGAPQPSDAVLAAAHADYVPATAQFFEVPVRRVASGSTSALNYLELLGVDSTLSVVDMRFVTSPCLMRRAECGALSDVSSAHQDYDYAPSADWVAAASAADVVLTDSYGTGKSNTQKDVDVDASFDPGILNRGEWIKFISLFFNKEAAANSYFSSLSSSIAAQSAAGAAAARALGAARAPVVAFVSYNAWSSNWQLSNATYKQQYVAGAGAALAPMPPPGGAVSYNNWTTPATTAVFADAAALRAALRGVTLLVDETVVYPQSPETYTYATFLDAFGFTPADVASGAYPFLSAAAVYREDKAINDGTYGQFGTDWFASSVAQPQAVLADFLAVLYPGAPAAAGHVTTWLRNLARNEAITVRESAQCADVDGSVRAACGGPTAQLSLPYFRFSAGADVATLQASLADSLADALPAGSGVVATVTDFQIDATLQLSGPTGMLDAAGGVAGFVGALGGVLGHPVRNADATPVVPTGRRLAAASVILHVSIDSFGAAGAPDAAVLMAQLGNATALLAAVRSAGAAAATGAAATELVASAAVTVTVKGTNADAGLASLQSQLSDGALGRTLTAAGLADVAPASSAGRASAQAARAAALVAAAAALFF